MYRCRASSTSIAVRRLASVTRALAVRVTMQRYDATITDEEADAAHSARGRSACAKSLEGTIRQ